MRSGVRSAKPFTTIRSKASTACSVPISSPYLRLFGPSASANANCTTSSTRKSNPSPSAKNKRQAGYPLGPPASLIFHGLGCQTLRRRLNNLFGAARDRILLFEAIDTSGGVHQLLAARKERVARGADFHTHVALVGGARLEGVGARAGDIDFVVSGVNSSLHLVTRGSFRELQYSRNSNPREPFGARGFNSLGDA